MSPGGRPAENDIGELAPDGLEVNGIFIGSDDSEMKVLFVCIAAPAGGKHAVGCALSLIHI